MKTLYKNYQNHSVEEDFAYMSESAKKFARAIKSALKREGKNFGFEVVSFAIGHYDCFAFVQDVCSGKYIYVSYDIPRYNEAIDLNAGGVSGCLYRTAKTTTDYTGGRSNFCSLMELPANIRKLFAE